MTQIEIKKAIGEKAASLVGEGMLLGLGTGTTATYFIESLIARCKQGLNISVVTSSLRSLEQAKRGGIPIKNMDEVETIDLTIDGADEIDPQGRMIKGGGGALVREKILATSSKEMIIIVDESKLVHQLGKFGLPVEILPFGYRATLAKIHALGYKGALRMLSNEKPYVSDNGNFIYDIHTPPLFMTPEQTHTQLIMIAGVVETGFFFQLPTRVLVGYRDGRVEFRSERQNGRNN